MSERAGCPGALPGPLRCTAVRDSAERPLPRLGREFGCPEWEVDPKGPSGRRVWMSERLSAFSSLNSQIGSRQSTTERTAHPRNWLLLRVRCLAQPDLSPNWAGPAHPPLCPPPAAEGPALAAWLTPFLNFLSHLNACCWLPRAQAVRTAVRSADSSQRRLGSLGGFSHSGRKRLVSSSSGCGRPSDPVGFPVILQPTLPTRTSLVSSLTKLLLT